MLASIGRTLAYNDPQGGPPTGEGTPTDRNVELLVPLPCTITGTAGADTLTGTAGRDVICGVSGNDTLVGGEGDDVLVGGLGNDTLRGEGGDDGLNGGDGYDVADYGTAPAAVTVNLATGTATGGAGSDSLTGLEAVLGSAFGDNLTGDAARNNLFGQGENDTINGGDGADGLDPGRGNDTVHGGEGFDVVSYFFRTGGVTVTLPDTATSPGNGETGESDTIAADVEGAQGGAGPDTLTGNVNANNLFGQGGNDTLDGQEGADGLDPGPGQDTLNGGEGFDIASYFFRGASVTLSLDNAANDGEAGEGDNIGPEGDVEGLQGGRGGDTLTGNAVFNRLNGQGGGDGITSRDEGPDQVLCGEGTDTVTADSEALDPTGTDCETVLRG